MRGSAGCLPTSRSSQTERLSKEATGSGAASALLLVQLDDDDPPQRRRRRPNNTRSCYYSHFKFLTFAFFIMRGPAPIRQRPWYLSLCVALFPRPSSSQATQTPFALWLYSPILFAGCRQQLLSSTSHVFLALLKGRLALPPREASWARWRGCRRRTWFTGKASYPCLYAVRACSTAELGRCGVTRWLDPARTRDGGK